MQPETNSLVLAFTEKESHPGRALVAFFSMTYVATWTLFITAGHLPTHDTAARLILLLVGASAPSLVAIALTARWEGHRGVRELLGRLLQWRVQLRWYAFALGYFLAIRLGAAVLVRVSTGAWPPFGSQAWYGVLVAIVASGIVGGPLGEEIGWRGYALPRLSSRFGPALGSLLLGLVWSCWHLPLFFTAGLSQFADQYGQSFPTYLLQVTALSVAIAWLMHNTRGSLLLAVLMHSAINQTKDLVPSKVPGASDMWALSSSAMAWWTVLLLWICAGYFLWRMRRPVRRRAGAPVAAENDVAPVSP